jgi:hypothetical protein
LHTFPATMILATPFHLVAALLLSIVISRRGLFTIFAPAGKTRCAFPTRARGVARVPGLRSITRQHPKDEPERYDTHSHNQEMKGTITTDGRVSGASHRGRYTGGPLRLTFLALRLDDLSLPKMIRRRIGNKAMTIPRTKRSKTAAISPINPLAPK